MVRPHAAKLPSSHRAAIAPFPSRCGTLTFQMLRLRSALLPVIWLALAASTSLPFLVAWHTYPLPTFYSEYVTAVCWIVAGLGIVLTGWRSSTPLPVAALAALALVVVLFAQLLLVPPLNPIFSAVGALFLLATAATCGLGVRCRDIPGTVEALAIGLIIGGLLTLGVELLQLLRVQGLSPLLVSGADAVEETGRRLSGNLNQPNHVASYLAMGLAATLLMAKRFPRWLVPLIITTVLLEVGMALSFSRTSWLHILSIGALSGWVVAKAEYGFRRWVRALTPLIVLVLTYQLCNWLLAHANASWNLGLATSLGERMNQVNHGVSDRLPIWRHAWHMFITHPWLGGGWGDYAWNQYVQTDVLGRVPLSTNAHNIVLDLLAKIGILGLLAVALPLLGLLFVVKREPITPARAFFYAVILIMAAHSAVEYPLHYLFFLLPFGFALGYVDPRVLRYPSVRMTSVLIAVIATASLMLIKPLWGDYKAVERLSYASKGFAGEVELYRQHGANLLDPYGTLAIASNWNVSQPMSRALVVMERGAVEFFPASGPIQRYALALAYLNKTEEAVIQVRRLRNLYWEDYPMWSAVLTESCGKRTEALAAFCGRLRSERLLVETSGESDARPAQMSKS